MKMEQKQISQKTNRSSFVDLIKGIAIILVVLGHCIQYGSGAAFLQTDAYYNNVVFKIIYSFHMPLFAMVSGLLFFYSAEKTSAVGCVNKQLLRLCVPVLSWTLCIEIAKMAAKCFVLGQNFDMMWLADAIRACLTEHWFVWAIFWCSMIVILNRSLFGDYPITYLLIFVLLPWIPDVGQLHLYAYLYPYFVGAYLCQKYDIAQKIRTLSEKWKIMAGILAAILWVLMLCGYNTDCYIYTSHISVFGKNVMTQLGIDFYRWAIGLIGCVPIMVLLYYVDKLRSAANWAISTLGKYTLGIYIVSSYLNVYVLANITKNFNLHYGILAVETVLMLLITCGITWVISRIKLLNRLFLGGR